MKRKKDYSISHPTHTYRETQLADVDRLKLHFTDEYGRLVQSLDFSEFANRLLLAKHFMEAFNETQFVNKPITRRSTFHALRRWFRFLDVASIKVNDIKDISTELLKEYIRWIDQHGWSLKTNHREYHSVKPLLVWLKKKHKLNDLNIVTKVYPHVNESARPPEKLNELELAEVLRAARAEIEKTWNDYQKGQSLLAEYTLPKDDIKTDLRDLAALLSHIKIRYGGVLPSTKLLARQHKTYLTEAVILHGGTEQVCRYLHATNESLTAYKIVITAETFGNGTSIHTFKRDGVSPHPLLGNRTILSWEKGRSNHVQRRSFDHRKSGSLPKLIDQVRLLTEPLVPHADPADRQYLFLSRTRRSKGSIRVGLSSYENNLIQLEDFCRRNNIRNSKGELLKFNLTMLRPTGLTLAYRKLGGDIIAVRRLANHASSRTTATYVAGPEMTKDNDTHIAKLQAQWIGAIGQSVMDANELKHELEIDETNAEAIITGRNATSSGFVCKDPFAGAMSGQKKGQLCIAWLGCFVCPNAVIPMEPKYLARILQVWDHLLAGQFNLHPNRWQLLYAPIIKIIERDIYPRFTNPWIIDEAREIAKALPPLPALT